MASAVVFVLLVETPSESASTLPVATSGEVSDAVTSIVWPAPVMVTSASRPAVLAVPSVCPTCASTMLVSLASATTSPFEIRPTAALVTSAVRWLFAPAVMSASRAWIFEPSPTEAIVVVLTFASPRIDAIETPSEPLPPFTVAVAVESDVAMILTLPASATTSASLPRYACVWPLTKTFASLEPPAPPMPTVIAIVSVSAVTVAFELASTSTLPEVAVTFEPSMYASVSLPMVFVVNETAPEPPMSPRVAAKTGSVAEIVDRSSAVSFTARFDSTRVELAMKAFVFVVVVFVACAPPPLKEPSVEIASAAAVVSAVIVAVS